MKKILSNSLYLFALVIPMFLGTSCDDNGIDDEQKATGYVIGLRASDGDASADYLVTVDDLMTGEISAAGQGIEQAGWSYYLGAGDKYFTLGYSLNEVQSYVINDGYLEYEDKFLFDRIDMIATVDDDYFIGIGAPWGGGSYDCQIQWIDIDSVLIKKNVAHPLYESFDSAGTQLNAWPTSAYVVGDKMYVSVYPLNGATWETPNTDEAIVSVFSYPEFEFITTFKDDRTGPIGYYATQPAILKVENGDHYTLSPSSFMAGYTQRTKPSGILKIKNGESAFDQDYFFNIEEFGYKVLSGVYVGDNKAVVKVIDSEIDATPDVSWGAFGNYMVMEVAVIDLVAKTFTKVEDIPLHRGQYATPYYVEDGKVYLVVGTETEWNLYQVDPASATAVKGASIDGIDIQGIYKY